MNLSQNTKSYVEVIENDLITDNCSLLTAKRLRLNVSGVVQGVGFRPFVFAAAEKFGLKGFVGNESRGVFIEIEGDEKSLNEFQCLLNKNCPPLSHITKIDSTEIEIKNSEKFEIFESESEVEDFTLISPDISVCEDCLQEFFDENDRRFRYPFINCTNCGPRFTITKEIPYDRPNTTMRDFKMCAECLHEYENPHDRRFHAQPNACEKCGPRVWFVEAEIFKTESVGDRRNENEQAIRETQNALKNGQIVAIKGIGGFHLACDAKNDEAIEILRTRKGRVDKPFAVMCKDLETAEKFVEINDAERELLTSKERPIALLKKKKDTEISDLIAPGNQFLGVMLPYSPIHFLLFENKIETLVMTSGNFSNEPIVKNNDEALEKLSKLADAFLFHDREIYVQCDDSVMRIFNAETEKQTQMANRKSQILPIRRSRGYAPFPVELPFEIPEILAVGGELKATFCLTRENFAFMSQHIGDMENLETLASFERSFEQMKNLFRVEPKIFACDKHPNYLSSNWARTNAEKFGAKLIEVQHHHAHIASVMAENGLEKDEKVIGFAFDGTGFGDDGAIWGGEVFFGGFEHFERIAHLEYFPLAGGDFSVKNVYRIALTLLRESEIDWSNKFDCVEFATETERKILSKQLENDLNIVRTSSFGRFFDAVASLANVRHRATYEAQAAIEFEAILDENEDDFYKFDLSEDSVTIGWKNLIRSVAEDVLKNENPAKISAKFHNAVARLIVDLSYRFRESYNINKIALSGGCFQNAALLKKSLKLLVEKDFEVFTHRKVPPNDGGLALGQAVLASQNKTK